MKSIASGSLFYDDKRCDSWLDLSPLKVTRVSVTSESRGVFSNLV